MNWDDHLEFKEVHMDMLGIFQLVCVCVCACVRSFVRACVRACVRA